MNNFNADKINFIADASQAFVAVESLEELLPIILDVAEQATSAEASSYLRFDKDSEKLRFIIMRLQGKELDHESLLGSDFALTLDQGISGQVARTRIPELVHDVSTSNAFYPNVDRQTGYETRSMLCVPVVFHGDLYGVIQVINPSDKPHFDDADLQFLGFFATMAASAIARARYMATRLMKKEQDMELAIAAKIQKNCWPKLPEPVDGIHIWGKSIAAKAVGGDFYDYIKFHDGSYLLYVADVSGKGLPACLVMVALWSAIRSEATTNLPITELLRIVNESTYEFMSGESFFATISMMRFWPETGKIQIASGGHGLPLIHDGTDFVELAQPSGLPLGTLEEQEFEMVETLLPSGGLVLQYSDGLTEAFNEQGEMFGLERAKDIIRRTPPENCGQATLEAILEWTGKPHSTDDLTLLALHLEAD